ncbi:MAG: M48 family metalloprotease [Bacteroidota bacterium]
MRNRNLWLWPLLALLTLTACENLGEDDTLVRIHKEEFDLNDQHVIGSAIVTYMNENPLLFPVLDRTEYLEVYNYVDVLLETLITTTEISTREDFNWEIVLLQDDNIRSAFAAPGGKVFIYTGLLKFIEAENELMTVIAHEVSYSESGRVMNYLANKYSRDLFFLGDILLGYDVGDAMAELCSYLKDLIYTTDEVVGADEFAINLICPFQYNALGMKSILDLAEQSTSEVFWLNVRPSAEDRIEKIIENANPCGDEEDPTFGERYAAYKLLLP